MSASEHHQGFLPDCGNYADLLSFQKAEAVYDLTFRFAHKFLSKTDRTIDQMIKPRNGDDLPHAKRQRRKEVGGREDVMIAEDGKFGSPRECFCASTQSRSPTRSLASLRLCVSRFHFGF